MGAFQNTKSFPVSLNDYSRLARDVEEYFAAQGYEVVREPLPFGGQHLSLKKGKFFKMVLGMQTSLNVEITRSGGVTTVDAKVGVFGKQLLPTAISMFVLWPVLLTQIWGLVQQSNLDDEVMQCVEDNIYRYADPTATTLGKAFCVECGSQISDEFAFCPKCGAKRVA